MNGANHESSPRRGIWEWARAGTGKLSIIGRLPHPEWKSPASSSSPKPEAVVVNGTQPHPTTTPRTPHDDFSIPSTTTTSPHNHTQQALTAAAKLQGLGISNFSALPSPADFSQTRPSSDDLIANASETTGSPSPQIFKHDLWTNGGDDTTPTGSKVGSPVTAASPDTPTPSPPHQRSDSIIDIPKLREKKVTRDEAKEITSETVAQTLRDNIAALSPAPRTPHEGRDADDEKSSSSAPTKPNGSAGDSNGNSNGDKPESARSGGATAKGTEASAPGRRIPTYKIALSPALMLSPSLGRRAASGSTPAPAPAAAPASASASVTAV